MLWNLFGELQWLAIVAVVGGGFGRAVKARFETMHKLALPVTVVVFCYALVFSDLAAAIWTGGNMTLGTAALYALSGVFAAGGAVMGHEVAKKVLASVFGETFAEVILGVLTSKLPRPPVKPGGVSTVLALALALTSKYPRPSAPRAAALALALLTLGGCGMPSASAVASVLRGVSDGAALLASAIDVGAAGAEVYFARHPSDTEGAVSLLALEAREAQAVVVGLVADGVTGAQLDKARAEALRRYGAYRAKLQAVGVTSATPPLGGAESDSPPPQPFSMPTVEEIGARL